MKGDMSFLLDIVIFPTRAPKGVAEGAWRRLSCPQNLREETEGEGGGV